MEESTSKDKRIVNSGRFQKGHKLSDKHIEKLRSLNLGENNRLWKGDEVGYFGLHVWVRRHFPPPDKCGFCHEKKKLQLANMTGVYDREFKNWKYLCSKCHMDFDEQHKKAWETRRSV